MSIEERTTDEKVDRLVVMVAGLGARVDELERLVHGRGEPGNRPSPWPADERER